MDPVAAASPTPTVDPLPSIPETTVAKDKAADRKRFEALYSVVRDDLLADFRKHNIPEESIEYYRRVRAAYRCICLSCTVFPTDVMTEH